MRLLRYDDEHARFQIGDFSSREPPPYATLSDTWGSEASEVSCEDFVDGKGPAKSGFRKLQLCRDRVRRDHLKYFWIDTCCLMKSDDAALDESINCMFEWYRKSAKCYVYLADVSACKEPRTASEQPNWQQQFKQSRWFKRGWTLLELIAPSSVDFFAADGQYIGSKETLEDLIVNATGIPAAVLRGSSLSDFILDERLLWQTGRQTHREEDIAYSLMGICGVHFPIRYGEGRASAWSRLRGAIDAASEATRRDDFSVTFSLARVCGVSTFVGRQAELQSISSALQSDGGRRTVVLHGLGGIGKTQLAIEYAKQHHGAYSAIFWLDSKDTASLRRDFYAVAKQIVQQHPSAVTMPAEPTESDFEGIVDAVRAWLSRPHDSRWLMIFDNYDNPKTADSADSAAIDIRTYLPEAWQGSVIITTRSSQVSAEVSGEDLAIEKLGRLEEGLQILATVSRRREAHDDGDARKLAERLDGFPLALSAAGAYLREISMPFSTYLRNYDESWLRLQKRTPVLESYRDRALHTTWQITFERVQERNELSARLLRWWAWFNNQDLYYEMLCHTQPDDPEWLLRLTEDELSFTDAMRVLCNYGLAQRDSWTGCEGSESAGYSMHGCVHSWIKHALNADMDAQQSKALSKLFVQAIYSHVAADSISDGWPISRRLLRHADPCVRYCSDDTLTGTIGAHFLDRLGRLYKAAGRYNEAQLLLERSLQEREAGSGGVLSLSGTIHQLATVYRAQARLPEAEIAGLRALLIRESHLGPEDPSVLDSVANLGFVYWRQGRLEDAERLQRRVLLARERFFGRGHSKTLASGNNLGLVYLDQGDLEKGEETFCQVFSVAQGALGLSNPTTLTSADNLALAHRKLGKLNSAEQLWKLVLETKQKVFGPEHPRTLGAALKLGGLYRDLGRLGEADMLLDQTLRAQERTLGAGQPGTRETLVQIAALRRAQGRLVEAEELARQLLQGGEICFGPEHANTLMSLQRLGSIYRDRGKLHGAEQMLTHALRLQEKVLPAQHPQALITMAELAKLYWQQSQLQPEHSSRRDSQDGSSPADLPEDSLAGGPPVIIPKPTAHPFDLPTRPQPLARADTKLEDQPHEGSKISRADALLVRALRGQEQKLGATHIATLQTAHTLGLVRQAQSRSADADELFRRAGAGIERALGPQHVMAQDVRHSAGALAAARGARAEAEDLLVRAFAAKEALLGRGHVSTVETARGLARLYREDGRVAEAELVSDRVVGLGEGERGFGEEGDDWWRPRFLWRVEP